MIKNLSIFILLFLIVGCSSSNQTLQFTVSENKIDLPLPKPEEVKNYEDDHQFREKHFIYSDGSIFFITDDSKSGSEFNQSKVEKFGDSILLRIATSDTLDIFGESESGFWREIKFNNPTIVAGYFNTSKEMKSRFDSTLSELFKPH